MEFNQEEVSADNIQEAQKVVELEDSSSVVEVNTQVANQAREVLEVNIRVVNSLV